jgi:hypothetical protein
VHKSVTSLSFPRYGHSVAADLASEALRGEHVDLAKSIYAMVVFVVECSVQPSDRFSVFECRPAGRVEPAVFRRGPRA